MTNFNLALGHLIAARRRRMKLTQVVLAKRADVSQSRVSRIEAGASPTLFEFEQRAPALGSTMSKLWREAKRVVDIATKAAAAAKVVTVTDLVPIIVARVGQK